MGTLYIVSTPIGNLEDITLRALRILKEVDIIACEDTRTTSQLLNLLSTKFAHVHNFSGSAPQPKLIRYDDRTEISKAPEILELLTNLCFWVTLPKSNPTVSSYLRKLYQLNI